MAEKGKKRQMVFCSIDEFNKVFFPKAYEERARQKKRKDLGKLGTGLADELLENIQKHLAKKK